MRTRCLTRALAHQENILKPSRLVHKVLETTEGGREERERPGEGERTLPLRDKMKDPKIRENLAKPIPVEKMSVTMKKLAEKIDGKKITEDQIGLALMDSYKKYKESLGGKDFSTYWVEDLYQKNCNISIVFEGDTPYFEFTKPDGEKIKWEHVPVSEEPPAAPPEGGTMREVDAAAEKAEQERIANEAEGRRVRTIVFRNENDVSGRAMVPKTQKERNEIGAVFIKLEKIYPDARKGDKVIIRTYSGRKRIAVYDGSKFVYEQPAQWKSREVKTRWNYKLQFVPNEAAREAEKPRAPEGVPVQGYLRVRKAMSWNAIALKVMRRTDVPRGTDIDQAPTSSPVPNSPAARIAKLGYKVTNKKDVEAYAKLLQEGNKGKKLYVWCVIPKGENPRIVREKREAARKKRQREATRRNKERQKRRTAERYDVIDKHFDKLYYNKEYKIHAKLEDIVDDDDLWNYYWEQGHLNGIDRVKKGFEILNIPEGKQRGVLLDAIQQGDNDIIDFEDFIDAFDNKNLNVYMNKDKERGTWSDFHNEFYFYQIATNIQKGKSVSAEKKKFYDENYEDYVTEAGIVDVEVKYRYLVNIVKGTALVFDGLQKMRPGVSIEYAKAGLEVAEERREEEEEKREKQQERQEEEGAPVTERLEREPWQARTEEDKFLQKFFHPKNTQSLDSVIEEDTLDEDKSDFANRYSEEAAYQMIRLQAADEEDPTKMDRGKMVNVMNGFIRNGLMNFFNKLKMLRKGEDAEDKGLQSELEKMAKRYFGTEDLDDLNLPVGEGTPMQRALKFYEFDNRLALGNESHTTYRRNLLHDGFMVQREIADGKIKLGEELAEHGEWKNFSEVLEAMKNEGAKQVVLELLRTQPKFRELPPDELKKAAEDIDAFMSKEHQWEGESFDHGVDDLQTKDNRLFDINAGFDFSGTDTGGEHPEKEKANFYLGLSKEILTIPGIDVKLSLGIAVNPITGEVVIGVLLAKEFELSKQWSANIKGAAGVEVTKPAIAAGVSGGFTWMSKGSAESAWRTKIDFGVGVGGSLSFNLTDIYLGPYVYVGVGEKQDFNEQASKLYTNAYLENRLDEVDAAGGVKEKAIALQRLPRGVGEFLTEVKYNLGWTDRELVNFYDLHMKKALRELSLNKTLDGASGVSEWGVGGTIDPIKLIALAVGIATANPALVIGAFVKLGFVVGSSIKVKRKVSEVTEQQAAFERKVCEEVNKMFPTVDISYEVLRFEDMDKVTSRNFAGSRLQRALGLPSDIKPGTVEQTEVSPDKSDSYKELQAKFAKGNLLLGYDEEEKMYTLKPTMTQTYRMYIDPDIAKGYGLIIKGGKILIASKADLSGLHVRRFDVIYQGGYVQGAVQHTMITLSDNPFVKMENLAEQDSYIVSKYDRSRGISGELKKKGGQENIFTYAAFKQAREGLFTATIKPEDLKQKAERSAKDRRALELTAEAFKLPTPLQENIDLSQLKVPPEKFSKMWQYQMLYRKLTTIPPGGTERDFKKLDAAIQKENDNKLTEDQLILYKEKLFSLSMSEETFINREATINARLQWSRNAVYIPFFRRKMKESPNAVPSGISAEDLADAFLEAIREHLKDKPKTLDPGQSLFTAVGTFYINGIRRVEAASGQQNKNNEFTEGFDYSKFLVEKGAAATIEQRTIAKLLLEEHSEIPTENTGFLQSRLAKKLFYMGREGHPNPLVEVIGEDKFKQLIAAYKEIEAGKEAPAGSADGIKALREVAEKIRRSQLGEGQPVTLDGNRPGRAVIIGDFVFVIETTLKSGIYEFCKNPSVLYDESITVFSLPKLQEYQPDMSATVFSGAGDVVALETRHAEVWSIGLNAIGKYSIEPEVQEDHIPPPPKQPPGRIPAKPTPRPAPAPEVSVDEEGPGTNAGSGDSGSFDSE